MSEQIGVSQALICVIASQIANLGESIIGAVFQEKEGFQWVSYHLYLAQLPTFPAFLSNNLLCSIKEMVCCGDIAIICAITQHTLFCLSLFLLYLWWTGSCYMLCIFY